MRLNIGTQDISQNGAYGFLIVLFKERIIIFPCSFFLIPSGQNVDVMVNLHGARK